jgi:hypothetical protein
MANHHTEDFRQLLRQLAGELVAVSAVPRLSVEAVAASVVSKPALALLTVGALVPPVRATRFLSVATATPAESCSQRTAPNLIF